ncbi:thymidine kinase 2, mitochondrial-like isoform X2 [Amphiura filiformis]|uniref:thymidine kinase 2, mitochondrial-like isoform X2 n=1 Tax=Amphiura filiformis TaxID=82378 RepID=UPI003B21C8D5
MEGMIEFCDYSTAASSILAMNGRKIKVAVEGNIGSGKSTLLKYFNAQDGVQVVMEPVQKWRDNKGCNMLDLTYRDPSRWSFTFQSFAQLTMLEQHRIPHTAPIKMMERSIFSAKYCFVENLYRSKKMNSSEYMVLTEWFDWIVNTQDLQLDQIVYLRTTPEMCQKRIKNRCRSEEQGIPMQYLQELHELHEDWLIRGNKFKLPAPVMVLDASKPLEQMFEVFDEQRDQILLQQL